MIHPSYSELIKVINQEAGEDDATPAVTSRYSVVLATSRRARQLISGDKPLVNSKENKPLSIAVEEFYEGKVKILPEEQEEPEELELEELDAMEDPAEDITDEIEDVTAEEEE